MSARELITDHRDLWTGAVTSRSTAGRGRNGKIELTGIKKLRELILELAVRGKLLEQDPDDEPASVLLDRIAEEKARLVKEGKIKNAKKVPEVSIDEKSFITPSNWQWGRLEQLFLVVTDGDHQAPPKAENGTPFLVISNINSGKVDFAGCRKVTDNYYKKLDWKKKPVSGDLLYTVTGSYGIPVIVNTNRFFCVQRHIAILKPSELAPISYFKLFLSSPYAKNYASSIATGIAQKTVPLTGLRKLPIAIPPIEEQHRIVEKVDDLMALCDRLEQQEGDQLEAHEVLVDTLLDALTRSADAAEVTASWARIAEHFDILFTTEASIDKLKQAILQLAVMGRLVEQDPNDEPASVLLQRIAEEKARLVKEGKIKKTKSLPAIETNKAPLFIPSTWEMARIGEFVSLISGQHLKGEEYTDSPEDLAIPYLTGPAEFGDLSPSPTRFTNIKRAVANPSDILITCKGSGVGSLNIAETETAISRQLMAIRPIGVNKRFIFLLMGSLRKSIREKIVGIAIPGISREDITYAVAALPPLAEQKRIVDKFDELMALCDQLKARLAEAGETRTHLAEAVVEQAVN